MIIPGVLLTYWLPICFPQTVQMASAAGFPDAIDFVGFAAIAVFLGQLLQAVASALEGAFFRTWRGKPSQRVFVEGLGDRYVSRDAAQRIRSVLVDHVSTDASDGDLFQFAMTVANSGPGSRSERFNALYAYHRVLVVVVALAILLLAASRGWGVAQEWSQTRFTALLLVLFVILVFMWHRARQRAYYFVKEVLNVADRALRTGVPSNGATSKESSANG